MRVAASAEGKHSKTRPAAADHAALSGQYAGAGGLTAEDDPRCVEGARIFRNCLLECLEFGGRHAFIIGHVSCPGRNQELKKLKPNVCGVNYWKRTAYFASVRTE